MNEEFFFQNWKGFLRQTANGKTKVPFARYGERFGGLVRHTNPPAENTPKEVEAVENTAETTQTEGSPEPVSSAEPEESAEATEGEYLWWTHIKNKFENENPKEAEHAQRTAVQKQGFLENFELESD